MEGAIPEPLTSTFYGNIALEEHYATLVRDASPPPPDDLSPLRFGCILPVAENAKQPFVLTRKRRLIRDGAEEQATRESLGVQPDEYINHGLKMCNMIVSDSLPQVRRLGCNLAMPFNEAGCCSTLTQSKHTDSAIKDATANFEIMRNNCSVGSIAVDLANTSSVNRNCVHTCIPTSMTSDNCVELSASHMKVNIVSDLEIKKLPQDSTEVALHKNNQIWAYAFNNNSCEHMIQTPPQLLEVPRQSSHHTNESSSIEILPSFGQLSSRPGKYDHNYYTDHSIVTFIPNFKQLSERRKPLSRSASQITDSSRSNFCTPVIKDLVYSQQKDCICGIGPRDNKLPLSNGSLDLDRPSVRRCSSKLPNLFGRSPIITRSSSRKNKQVLCIANNNNSVSKHKTGVTPMVTRSTEKKNRGLLLDMPVEVKQFSYIALSQKRKTPSCSTESCKQLRGVTNHQVQSTKKCQRKSRVYNIHDTQSKGRHIKRRQRLSRRNVSNVRSDYIKTNTHEQTNKRRAYDITKKQTKWLGTRVVSKPCSSSVKPEEEVSSYHKSPNCKRKMCEELYSLQRVDSSDSNKKDPLKVSQSRRLFEKLHEISKWAFDKIARNSRGD